MANGKVARAGITLGKGLVVGLCATQALDWVSILIYENEDEATRTSEDRARGGLHAYEVAVERMAARRGMRLNRTDLARAGWTLHKIFGVLGGVGYLGLRRLFPVLRQGGGLVFGTLFFLLVDEVLVPAMKLTPGPRAFSWKVHARGAAAHVAYGIAAELTARLMDRPAEDQPVVPNGTPVSPMLQARTTSEGDL